MTISAMEVMFLVFDIMFFVFLLATMKVMQGGNYARRLDRNNSSHCHPVDPSKDLRDNLES